MCIKKLTSILVVMALLLASGGMAGQAATVSNEQETKFVVNLEITSSYDLDIPAFTTFSLSEKSAEASVSATASLGKNEILHVYLDYGSDELKLSNGTDSIPYTVVAYDSETDGEQETGTREHSIFVGDVVGAMTTHAFSTVLKFSLPSNFDPENYSRGTYTQTLTFHSWIETDS